MTTNERLKQVRQTLGLTQGKFAGRIAISLGYVAEMELGKKPVNERIIRLISAEYGVNEHWFRTGEGMMYNAEEDIAVAEVVSIFKSLHPQCKELALAHLNALADWQSNHQEVRTL